MAEMGNKFECAECGTKFYDLGNPNAVCPKCGTAPRRDSGEVERRAPPPRVRREEEEEVTPAASDDDDAGDDIEEVVDAGDDD